MPSWTRWKMDRNESRSTEELYKGPSNSDVIEMRRHTPGRCLSEHGFHLLLAPSRPSWWSQALLSADPHCGQHGEPQRSHVALPQPQDA